MLAVNFADELLNPAELGVTEEAMTHVATGTSVLIQAGPDTNGHQTLADPKVWAPALLRFMAGLPHR